jgi:uncharacterized protein YciI
MRCSVFVSLFLLAVSCVFAGCATSQEALRRPDDAPMTLVYLDSGPNAAAHTTQQKREIFQGHMANMQRLADEGTLIIAGPFDKPRDPAWRGLFVLDVADPAEAMALAGTDPGVASGEFRLRVRPITASASLREALQLEDQMQAELNAQDGAERKPGELPPGLRGYVMLHADDIAHAWKGLAANGAGPRIIWWARFRDGDEGVVVLDATDVQAARAALKTADLGPHGLDGWLSTRALERLPEAARE